MDQLSNYTSSIERGLTLGRLSIKEEPAGKARVFAITDSITQTIMLPLHEEVFLDLKIPSDGRDF